MPQLYGSFQILVTVPSLTIIAQEIEIEYPRKSESKQCVCPLTPPQDPTEAWLNVSNLLNVTRDILVWQVKNIQKWEELE